MFSMKALYLSSDDTIGGTVFFSFFSILIEMTLIEIRRLCHDIFVVILFTAMLSSESRQLWLSAYFLLVCLSPTDSRSTDRR